MLLVHRDAEGALVGERKEEVDAAVGVAGVSVPYAAVVPVRMMEAWLLSDEGAIRTAAGNPNGTSPLNMPSGSPESIPDPKSVLHDALRAASERVGRRRARFNVFRAVHRVAELTDGFGALRGLPAFDTLEQDLRDVIQSQGWGDA